MSKGKDVVQPQWVYLDGDFVPIEKAQVSILTHALHYGTGVFEGIRGYWESAQRELLLMRAPEHYARWKMNCRILGIDLPFSTTELCELTLELIRRNQFQSNIYVRPIAFRSAARIGIQMDQQFSCALIVVPLESYLRNTEGIHAGVVSWRRVEDNAIPGRGKICGAYVNSALACDEAVRHGYDDAILLTENGHISEGTTSNLFLVRDGQLITPAVTENILEGITRASVIELAEKTLDLNVRERRVDRSELYVSEELFFTGTASEVTPIIRVDQRPVGDGRVGPITAELRRLYMDAVRGLLPDYQKWLLPVYQGVSTKSVELD